MKDESQSTEKITADDVAAARTELAKAFEDGGQSVAQRRALAAVDRHMRIIEGSMRARAASLAKGTVAVGHYPHLL